MSILVKADEPLFYDKFEILPFIEKLIPKIELIIRISVNNICDIFAYTVRPDRFNIDTKGVALKNSFNKKEFNGCLVLNLCVDYNKLNKAALEIEIHGEVMHIKTADVRFFYHKDSIISAVCEGIRKLIVNCLAPLLSKFNYEDRQFYLKKLAWFLVDINQASDFEHFCHWFYDEISPGTTDIIDFFKKKPLLSGNTVLSESDIIKKELRQVIDIIFGD